jgi:phage shock protein E
LRTDLCKYTLGGMRKALKMTLALGLASISLVALAACSSNTSIDASKFQAIIDVRTPAEYSTGHLQGAINLDIEGPSFTASLASLPKSADYLLYCHSGRRAGLAIDAMKQDGFTGNLVNAGGFAEASSATGLPLVTN